MPNVWIMRAGGDGELADIFLRDNHISVGYNLKLNATGLTERSDFRDACGRANPDKKRRTISAYGDSVHRFITRLAPGDYVVTPTANRETVRFGVIVNSSPYFEERDLTGRTHHHRRRVHWDQFPFQLGSCSPEFRKALGLPGTVFSLNRYAQEFFDLIGRPSLIEKQ